MEKTLWKAAIGGYNNSFSQIVFEVILRDSYSDLLTTPNEFLFYLFMLKMYPKEEGLATYS